MATRDSVSEQAAQIATSFPDEFDLAVEDLNVDGRQTTDDPAEDTAIVSLDGADRWLSLTSLG